MLSNKNVEKLEIMAQDYLQYRYRMFCLGRRNADWSHYRGACEMVEAFGGEWRRHYRGKDDNQVEIDNPDNYSHTVFFPSKETCERLNEDAWK